MTDRARHLGLLRSQAGARALGAPAPRRIDGMAQARDQAQEKLRLALGATEVAKGVLKVEHTYGGAHRHGRVSLEKARSSLSQIGSVLDEPRSFEHVLYLDTETTGLAGGTGTKVFQIGLGEWRDGQLVVTQYLMCSPAAESAFLTETMRHIARAELFVSFNGKSFDMPLLETRFRMCRQAADWGQLPHFDLLHFIRRAFSHRLPRCRLVNAEESLLGFYRVDDLDGSLAPEAWRVFVQRGQWRMLARVMQHNLDDVVSLAALSPDATESHLAYRKDTDVVAVANFWLRRHQPERALALLPADAEKDSKIAMVRARALRLVGRHDESAELLAPLAQARSVAATEHLAKYQEHRARNLVAAERWAYQLTELEPNDPRHQHRLRRVQAKSKKIGALIPVSA